MRRSSWMLLVLAAAAVVAFPVTAAADRTRVASDQGAGGWVWPLSPRPTVLRGFDLPPAPWLPGHRGVDLVAHAGQDVGAAGAGVVVFAGMVAGRPVVSISHGALRTTYEPVDPHVKAGDRVDAGMTIGVVSTTGTHCEMTRSCLHWGLRRGAHYLDPLALVGGGPIRLLPTWDRHTAAAWTPPMPSGPRRPAATSDRRPGGSRVALATASLVAAGGLAAAAAQNRGRH